MTFFIIRHKATGKFMPPKRGTWWEPTVDRSAVPRLFSRLVDAKNAKRYWEDGCLTYVTGAYDSFGNEIDPSLELSKDFGTKRKPDDLEILLATLSIGTF